MIYISMNNLNNMHNLFFIDDELTLSPTAARFGWVW